MIYPFPAYQNPVLGIRPAITCFSLLTVLLVCDIGSCRRMSPGSPAPQLTDLRSQITGVEELLEEFRKQLQQQRQEQQPEPGPGEDGWLDTHRHKQQQQHGDAQPGTQQQQVEEEAAAMQQELREVGVRPSGETGEDLCNFNHLEDYIIRTKDSLEAGATFLQAPAAVSGWKQCLELCCSLAGCSAAVVETSPRGLSCFLFDCTHRGRHVCEFSPHRDYSSYTLTLRNASSSPDSDRPPTSNAGQDVVLQLPVDWIILDGRESSDDHAIVLYDWTLLRGDPLVDMKVPQPGTLRLSHLQEGVYTLQLTVTDTSGQKSSDNVSVSVLPAEHHKSATSACTGVCSRYQFICDDGCCIDITLACDRVVQCPDGSDEAFCQNFSSGRKTVVHISEGMSGQENKGNVIGTKQNSAVGNSRPMEQSTDRNPTQELNDNTMLNAGPMARHTTLETSNTKGAAAGTVPSKTNKDPEKNFLLSENLPEGNGHPAPETGAVLPLALGLAITSLLLLMVVCRLQLVRQKLKKARPLTSEESDYLINGMYL